jgi:hypothetical protein
VRFGWILRLTASDRWAGGERTADHSKIVGQNALAHPPLHAGVGVISTAGQPEPPLEHADPASQLPRAPSAGGSRPSADFSPGHAATGCVDPLCWSSAPRCADNSGSLGRSGNNMSNVPGCRNCKVAAALPADLPAFTRDWHARRRSSRTALGRCDARCRARSAACPRSQEWRRTYGDPRSNGYTPCIAWPTRYPSCASAYPGPSRPPVPLEPRHSRLIRRADRSRHRCTAVYATPTTLYTGSELIAQGQRVEVVQRVLGHRTSARHLVMPSCRTRRSERRWNGARPPNVSSEPSRIRGRTARVDRGWWHDLEDDLFSGRNAYAEILTEWARISRGE